MGVIIFLFTAFQLYEGNIHGPGIMIYVLFNLLAVLFWVAKEIVQIDIPLKRIGEGFKVLGLRRMNWIPYSEIEKIYINSVKTVGEDNYSLPNKVTVRYSLYKAFIKTTSGDKLLLMVDNDKDLLLKKLNELNEKLKTQIIDQG
jgi:hypothetical protein